MDFTTIIALTTAIEFGLAVLYWAGKENRK